MNKRLSKTGLIIFLLTIFIYACSGKEFRSPIVFRSPVVPDKPDSQKTAERSVSSTLPDKMVALEEPTTDSSLPPDLIHSPAGIPIISEQELSGKGFSTLGRIYVDASPTQEFTREKALQNLKVEAFKRYGSLAEGIINVNYQKNQRVSGDVIILEESESSSTISMNSENHSVMEEAQASFPFEKIQLLSSEDLYQLKFKVLGEVSVRDRSEDGLTEKEAIRILKMEAVRKYGSQAKGLTNLSLLRKQQKFFYTKVRKNISTPDKPDTYEKASAEVIVWF